MMLRFAAFVCFAAVLSGGSCCTTDSDILIDIIFVVDGSGSIGTNNFELVRRWLINATSTMFEKFGNRAQFGVLEYSNKDPSYRRIPIEKSTIFEIPFRLGDCDTVRCMTGRIENMKYLQSQTFTYYALRRTIEVEFPVSPNWLTAKKAIILMTDGTANDGTFLPKAYEACVEQDIIGFAIGVGNYRIDQLRTFANGGDTDERVFTRTDFNSLASVVDSLDEELEKAGFFCDECASGTDNCSSHADCLNLPDGFSCVCREGYYGDGEECKEIDYCSPDPCRGMEKTRCIVESEKPKCVCIEGYVRIDERCQDVDECSSNPCHGDNTRCTNLEGGYLCGCEEGYVYNRGSCIVPENQGDLVTIVTLILAFLILVIIIAVTVYLIRREHTYTIGEAGKDEESRDDCPMYEIRPEQETDA